MKKFLFVLFAMMASSSTSFAGSTVTGYISDFYVNDDAMYLFKLTNTVNGDRISAGGCDTFRLIGGAQGRQEMFKAIMYFHASQTKVKIYENGCTNNLNGVNLIKTATFD